MYCKKCGKLIADDSVYCKYCGTNQNEVTTSEAKPEPIKVDVNAKVDAKLVPSINTSWYKKFTDLQKKLLWGYGPHTPTIRLKRPVYRGFNGEGKGVRVKMMV